MGRIRSGGHWRRRRLAGTFATLLATLSSYGSAELSVGRADRPVPLTVMAVDWSGAVVDQQLSHASMSRVLPPELASGRPRRDQDALRWVVSGAAAKLPFTLHLVVTRPNGKVLDELEAVPLRASKCPAKAGVGRACASSPPIRACPDAVDADHPAVRHRSVQVEVGGRIHVLIGREEVASIAVGGPRETSLGPIQRLRARIRALVVRGSPGGDPPLGGDTGGAVARVRRELRTASQIWGQCGIHFGASDQLDVSVVDPPPPHMLALGCDFGLPASGGSLIFSVNDEKFKLATRAGRSPVQVARQVADQLRRANLRATVSVNFPTALGALRTADVLVRNRDGSLATVSAVANQPISTDPSLSVCLGEVDFTDGLTHFTDFDAPAGTVEERSLIKAFDDRDPGTIDLFIIPSFALGGRIGESFTFHPGGSVSNTVIMDRVGVILGARSFALAHEIGHILLGVPGHLDDYGTDQPSQLMDADASDGTIFGPRRLSIAECERALRQSGPAAPVALLHEWPLPPAT